MRVGYLIQSHTGVHQVERLVRTLQTLDPDAWLHVSHDIRGEPGIQRLDRLGVRVTRDPGSRGGFEPIARWIKAARDLRTHGGADFVVLLSGQDYPLRPLEDMHAALAASGDGFVENFPALEELGNHWGVREGRTRYMFRWTPGPRLSERMSTRLHWSHAINYLQPFARVNVAYGRFRLGLRGGAIPQGFSCRGGSMFTSISWRAVEYVLDVVDRRPDVMAWGRSVLVPDEAFVQSILTGMRELSFVSSARRYFRFDQTNLGHPKTLTSVDVPDALSSGDFFARKFDERLDPHSLDMVDEALGVR